MRDATFFSAGAAGRGPLPQRLRAARSERAIQAWSFPPHIWEQVAKAFPEAGPEGGRAAVEQGLRDWFVCCAWRGKRELGMPSKAVDEAWHELILDSVSYVEFCRTVFGTYLHHFPAGKARDTGAAPIFNTIWAWDRSGSGSGEDECSLWDLDRRLRVKDPWGVSDRTLTQARANGYAADEHSKWSGALALSPNADKRGYASDGGGSGCGTGGSGDSDGGGGGGCGGGCGGGSG